MTYVGEQLATEWAGWPKHWIEAVVEPKLDGYRLTALVDEHGTTTFHCRNAKPVEWGGNLGHIAEAISAMGFRACMLDGEVMAEDWNKTGIVRRKSPSPDVVAEIRRFVKFHVFDMCRLEDIASAKVGRSMKMVDPTPARVRREVLADYFHRETSYAQPEWPRAIVKLVEQFVAETDEDVQSLLRRMIAEGHEGAMVKDLDAPYVCDRTKSWLKLKPTKTVEMEITDSVEGTGKYVGMLGAFTCRDKAGTVVSVGTGLVDAQRLGLWKDRDSLPGKIIEVKMQDGGAIATARHPVFVRFRPDRTSL